jgi:Flp pilus assembly protein TadB
VVVVVIIVAIVLRGLSNHRTNPRTGRTADDGALQPATKHRTQHSSPGPADQRALTWTDAALTMVVMVVIAPIMAVVVAIAATPAVAYAVVVGAIVMVLRKSRRNRRSEQKRSNKDRFSKLGHMRLDAGFCVTRDHSC